MIMTRYILLLMFISFLQACVSLALNTEEAANANYGDYPDSYKQIIEDWFKDVLKDPENAEYNYISTPEKAYSRAAPLTGGAPKNFGYLVKVLVKEPYRSWPNSGWKEYRLLISNGFVIERIGENMYFSEPWYQ